jgi:ligand-binding SRPBCC domain-containing protein
MIIERQSIVDAPIEQVWARVVTPEGINDELRPWMTMSMPHGAESLTVDNVPVGTPIGRCWIRLFGVLPIDYDLLTIRQWRHECDVSPDSDGKTVVRDRITFTLRAALRPLTPIFAAGLRAFVQPSASAAAATLH